MSQADLPPKQFRRGPRLAVDWGKARIGVAACDPDGLLCFPVETVANDAQAIARLRRIITEYEPIEIVFGWPINLQGMAGPAVQSLGQVVSELAASTDLPIRLVDERMSTAQAARQLQASGKSSKQRRSVIDQAAAVAILEFAIEEERQTGRPAGRLYENGWSGA